MSWNDLDLHPRVLHSLRKAKVKSFTDVLTSAAADLMRQTRLSFNDIRILKESVSRTVQRQPIVSVLQLFPSSLNEDYLDQKLTTGCPVLDKKLKGGFLTNRITEIAGISAGGKTQLCLQLSLNAQLPKNMGGLGAGVAYICTEDAFPAKRLQQMVQEFQKMYSSLKLNVGDNIFIQHIADLDGMIMCLDHHLPPLLRSGKAKLVIIDSIAAIFRSEYSGNEAIQKAFHLRIIASKLHYFCKNLDATIICVNQVTDVMEISAQGLSTKSKVKPSLGLTWSNVVHCRFMLSRTTQSISLTKPPQHYWELKKEENNAKTILRVIEVVFAPNLSNWSSYFIIDSSGIKGIETRSLIKHMNGLPFDVQNMLKSS